MLQNCIVTRCCNITVYHIVTICVFCLCNTQTTIATIAPSSGGIGPSQCNAKPTHPPTSRFLPGRPDSDFRMASTPYVSPKSPFVALLLLLLFYCCSHFTHLPPHHIRPISLSNLSFFTPVRRFPRLLHLSAVAMECLPGTFTLLPNHSLCASDFNSFLTYCPCSFATHTHTHSVFLWMFLRRQLRVPCRNQT